MSHPNDANSQWVNCSFLTSPQLENIMDPRLKLTDEHDSMGKKNFWQQQVKTLFVSHQDGPSSLSEMTQTNQHYNYGYDFRILKIIAVCVDLELDGQINRSHFYSQGVGPQNNCPRKQLMMKNERLTATPLKLFKNNDYHCYPLMRKRIVFVLLYCWVRFCFFQQTIHLTALNIKHKLNYRIYPNRC